MPGSSLWRQEDPFRTAANYKYSEVWGEQLEAQEEIGTS